MDFGIDHRLVQLGPQQAELAGLELVSLHIYLEASSDGLTISICTIKIENRTLRISCGFIGYVCNSIGATSSIVKQFELLYRSYSVEKILETISIFFPSDFYYLKRTSKSSSVRS